MAFAHNDIDGVAIHYEVRGTGSETVLLHHGFSRSILEWLDYRDPLAAEFRVVLMDSRGHGHSDKPHQPDAYRLPTRVADVIAVLDATGTERAHYVGYSMGGQIGFGVAALARQRLCSLTVGGMHPYPYDAQGMEERAASLAAGIEAHVARTEESVGPFPEPYRSEFLANDGEALAAVMRGGAATRIDIDPSAIDLPTFLYCGDKDMFYGGAKRAATEIPDARFTALAGLGHLEAVLRADVALPDILGFLRDQSA